MPDLELNEITVSTGELCGSVYLDQGFLAYVERKLDTRLSLESRQSVSHSLVAGFITCVLTPAGSFTFQNRSEPSK